MANATKRPYRCCYADTAFTHDMEITDFLWAESWINVDALDWQCVSRFTPSVKILLIVFSGIIVSCLRLSVFFSLGPLSFGAPISILLHSKSN